MALYYYKNISLSRINLKKISGGKKEMYIYTRTYYIAIYKRNTTNHGAKRKKKKEVYILVYIEKTQPTPKQNVIYLYIEKYN